MKVHPYIIIILVTPLLLLARYPFNNVPFSLTKKGSSICDDGVQTYVLDEVQTLLVPHHHRRIGFELNWVFELSVSFTRDLVLVKNALLLIGQL